MSRQYAGEAPDEAAALLEADGPLAARIPGYVARESQRRMAAAVEHAVRERGRLVVEAGTGTGKTLAYLVPLLASGAQAVISTASKTLQEQLYFRDLPLVRDALEVPARVALLKGRANYLCLHRLGLSEGGLRDRSAQGRLARVREWAGRTPTGDIAEVPELSEDDPLWPAVTSTADNCLGSTCPEFGDCFVYRARRRAQEAEVLVVNHHLLFADLALREDGVGEVLPGTDAIVLDEAHQVPEIASRFFGLSLSSRQLSELGRDTLAEQTAGTGDMPELAERSRTLEMRVRQMRLALGEGPLRAPWAALRDTPEVAGRLDQLARDLELLGEALEPLVDRGQGLESCHRRCLDLRERLRLMRQPEPEDSVQWMQAARTAFSLHMTPLDVAPHLQRAMASRPGAWIFTSATLAVGGGFSHIRARVGLGEDADELLLESPFDFPGRALMYVPEGLPDPGNRDYARAVASAALPVLRASGGSAFFLFTSHRALREAARLLADELDFPLLVQGEAPRSELVRRFRAAGDAVLLGSASFWEGVDVRGPALRLVIIDRLPFAAPDDPVLRARLDALRRAGRNPFRDYQLPSAVIALKQGVGRLIRDESDQGVVMLCDPRLYSRSYGRVFRDSLPPMPVTRDAGEVAAFYRRRRGDAGDARSEDA